jgi:hypothetical protein
MLQGTAPEEDALQSVRTMRAFVSKASESVKPVKVDLSEPGKVFAGLFALYSGLVVIAVTALLLAPGIHHIMKRVHWEDRSDIK